MAADPSLTRHAIATASFRLCSDDALDEDDGPTITYTLTLTQCPTATEIAILALLNTDGHLWFSTFHEESETCLYRRPVSDLIQIWHPEKVEGGVFCLHLGKRGRRVGDEEVAAVDRKWRVGFKEMFGVGLEEDGEGEGGQKIVGAGDASEGRVVPKVNPKDEQQTEAPVRSKGHAKVAKGASPAETREDIPTNGLLETTVATEIDPVPGAVRSSEVDESALLGRESTLEGLVEDEPGLQVNGAYDRLDKWRSTPSGGQVIVQSVDREPNRRSKITGWRGTATQVTVSLRFIIEGTPLNAQIWQPMPDIVIPRTTAVQDLSSPLLPFMQKLVASDQALMANMQAEVYWLVFVPKLNFGDERDAYLDFTTSRVPFETVCDLLRDPKNHQEMMHVSIEFSGQCLDKPISTVQEALQPHQSSIRRICLGTIRDRLTDQDRIDRIAATVVIIGSLDMDEQTTISLAIVPVFLLKNLVIGDVLAGDTLPFRSDYDWRDQFAGVESMEGLLVRIREHVDDPEAADELPTAPSYCFHRFPGFGRLAKWPKDGVHITVRYVNMLQTNETAEVSMPTQQYFQLTSTDTLISVQNLILDKLAETGEAQVLFSGEMVEKWKMVTFILPQMDDVPKMYLWEAGSIAQFLRPDGDEVDGRLLVEAHVVAR